MPSVALYVRVSTQRQAQS
jgi:site-specific DNA recombinase